MLTCQHHRLRAAIVTGENANERRWQLQRTSNDNELVLFDEAAFAHDDG